MRNWSLTKTRRESNLNAKCERLSLPIIPADAVLMKPRNQPAVKWQKFFKDEDDFLSFESSLDSTIKTFSSEDISESETEKV